MKKKTLRINFSFYIRVICLVECSGPVSSMHYLVSIDSDCNVGINIIIMLISVLGMLWAGLSDILHTTLKYGQFSNQYSLKTKI